ncbi:hypothetical protein CF335_g8216, partial [Tilletia laevis]
MPATAATASAAAPTRPSPPAVRSVRAAAQLALEGIEPTSDRCAAFIRNTLHSHVSRATGRTGRITLLADEVKHLLAASTFLLHQNEHDIISRIDKATAPIDAVAATVAATTTSLQELKEKLSKPNISPPPQDSPPDIERDIGVWQTVKPRKRSKERKAPLAQRLPSTDMLITSANLKLPVFKGLSPKAVVTKARAAILSQRSKKSWEKVKEHPIEHIVRAARSLPSGDWILSVGTIGWANFLSMMKKDWIPALDPNARLKDANFEIAVHPMPRDFDTDNMEHVQEFWDQNPHSFHSSGFKWAGGPNDKKHGTLLLSFRRAADANELLKASVVWDHRMLETRRSTSQPPFYAGWRLIPPIFDKPPSEEDRTGLRAISYISSARFPPNAIIPLPTNSSDVCAFAITAVAGLPAQIFINIYNQKDNVGTLEAVDSLLDRVAIEYDNPAIFVLGDFNLHHELWNPLHYLSSDPRADTLLDIAGKHGLELRSEEGVSTFQHISGQSKATTIDLVWANRLGADLMFSCRTDVAGTHSHLSDHRALVHETMGQHEDRAPIRPPQQWDKVDWNDFNGALQVLLPLVPDPAALFLPHRDQRTRLDASAQGLVDTIQTVIRKVVPVADVGPRSKRWWDGRLGALRAACAKAEREKQRANRGADEALKSVAAAAWRKARAEYTNAIKHHKAQHWDAFLESVDDRTIWTAAKYKLAGQQFDRYVPPIRSET